jgi:acetylornithine deacetylase/succinyl-diaminopimelate desuccinylase-like protein
MDVRSYIAQNAGSFSDDLKQWLRIPSISADPARHPDVRASADWLAAHLRATGFPEVEIWETGTPESPGLPSVFACWPAADPAITVTVTASRRPARGTA